MPNFAFDVVLKGALRLDAPSEKQARKILRDVLNCADSNLGAWPDGQPVLAELSLHQDWEPDLYELDGEPPAITTKAYGGEVLLGDGERFRIFEEPARGFRVVRLADGADSLFQGDDMSERFLDNFNGDEFLNGPGENEEEADEFGEWCEANGELPPLPPVEAPVPLSKDSAKAFLLAWMAEHNAQIDIFDVLSRTRMGVPCVIINFIGPDRLEDDVTIWQRPDGTLAFDEMPL